MPTTRSTEGSSHKGSAHNQVINMLKDDHARVRKAFGDFDKLDVLEDSQQCMELVEHTCGELEVHTALEEELFYPAARAALDDAELVDEAEVEHMTVHMLMEQIKDMEPEEEKYAATFKVLGEYVKHHLKEEEDEMFPKLAKSKLDWDGLLQQMTERRQQLIAELMPEALPEAQGVGKAKPKGKSQDKSKGKGKSKGGTMEEIADAEVEEIGAGRSDNLFYGDPDPDDDR